MVEMLQVQIHLEGGGRDGVKFADVLKGWIHIFFSDHDVSKVGDIFFYY